MCIRISVSAPLLRQAEAFKCWVPDAVRDEAGDIAELYLRSPYTMTTYRPEDFTREHAADARGFIPIPPKFAVEPEPPLTFRFCYPSLCLDPFEYEPGNVYRSVGAGVFHAGATLRDMFRVLDYTGMTVDFTGAALRPYVIARVRLYDAVRGHSLAPDGSPNCAEVIAGRHMRVLEWLPFMWQSTRVKRFRQYSPHYPPTYVMASRLRRQPLPKAYAERLKTYAGPEDRA